MTPKEIVENLLFKFQFANSVAAKKEAIEAIKQYAREMCEEQKGICNALAILAPEEILNAPYPEELL